MRTCANALACLPARPRRLGASTVAALVATVALAAGLVGVPAFAQAAPTFSLFGGGGDTGADMTAEPAGAEVATAEPAGAAPAADPAAAPAADPDPAAAPAAEPDGWPVLQLNKQAFSCEAGQERTLKLTACDLSSDLASLSVEWLTSDPEVAEVDENGVVTTLAKGTATITASVIVDDVCAMGSCTVTVTNNRTAAPASGLCESAHDYANGCSDVWEWSYPMAYGMWVTFDDRCSVEDGFDFIELRGFDDVLVRRLTGTRIAGQRIWVDGDSFTVRLLSDESGTDWGFAVTSVEAQYTDGWNTDGTNKYYVSGNAFVTGDLQIDGTWYWFDPETGALGEKPADAVSTDPAAPAATDPATPSAPVGDGSGAPMGYEDPKDLPGNTIDVPDVRGLDFWTARDLLWGAGFGVDDEWQYSEGAEYGLTMDQSIEPGTIVEIGTGIVLTVSAGFPPQVEMPAVCNMDVWSARDTLWNLGLNVNEDWVYNDYAEYGLVIDQDAWGGHMLDPGSMVTLTVSAGPAPLFTMPDYTDCWWETVLGELVSWGATVVVNDEIWANYDYEEGRVYWTDPGPGETVYSGTTVTLYVTRYMDGTPVAFG